MEKELELLDAELTLTLQRFDEVRDKMVSFQVQVQEQLYNIRHGDKPTCPNTTAE